MFKAFEVELVQWPLDQLSTRPTLPYIPIQASRCLTNPFQHFVVDYPPISLFRRSPALSSFFGPDLSKRTPGRTSYQYPNSNRTAYGTPFGNIPSDFRDTWIRLPKPASAPQ
jgi:hypothetical protein